jgi:hypothetical protein
MTLDPREHKQVPKTRKEALVSHWVVILTFMYEAFGKAKQLLSLG